LPSPVGESVAANFIVSPSYHRFHQRRKKGFCVVNSIEFWNYKRFKTLLKGNRAGNFEDKVTV
ncbi:MAG: hypothetical protein ACRYFX_11865, partial [Janthinobacterium lividum]